MMKQKYRTLPIKESALMYARIGWWVLPVHSIVDGLCTCGDPACSAPGKHPRIKRWQIEATSDADRVKAWWESWPNSNIGIATGKEANLVVLDIDVSSQRRGDLTFKAWLNKHGAIPGTVEAITGGGGRHLFFKYPPETPIKNAVDIEAGVDIRGDGGYVVVAPSNHISGNRYDWKVPRSPFYTPTASLPVWLLNEVGTRKKRNIKTGIDIREREIIEEGRRHDTLFRFAGRLIRINLSPTAILAELRDRNKKDCSPPLPDEEIVSIAESIEKFREEHSQSKIGKGLTTGRASIIKKGALRCPNRQLRTMLQDILSDSEEKSANKRRLIARDVLLRWMQKKGKFIISDNDEIFYLYKPEKRLYNIESNFFGSFLYSLTDCNPSSTDYLFLREDCRALAYLQKERTKVVRVSYWDNVEKILYVSLFDGRVVKLDGVDMTLSHNGKEVLFYDDPLWESVEVERGDCGGSLRWFTDVFVNWVDKHEIYGLAFRSWIISTFFTELCPTRPLLVLLGEKGSGKSLTLRLLMRLIFGSIGEVSGVPDKPDGFTATASTAHLLAIDNLDEMVPWMRDKLARISTGTVDHYRRLYTSNEEGTIKYRVWLAFTARTPDTLRRDDLTDRLVILPVSRIGEEKQQSERTLHDQISNIRNKWWKNLLETLNSVVRQIRNGELTNRSKLRMADWETLGRLLAQIEGKEDEWEQFCKILLEAQSDFLLQEDPICDAIERFLENPDNMNRKILAREMYQEFQEVLFEDRTPKGWYKSPQSFSKKLAAIRTELKTRYNLNWEMGTGKRTLNRWVYWFEQPDMFGDDYDI